MRMELVYILLMGADWLAVALITDALLRSEYESHHDHWVAEGGNRGFFWRPPGKAGSIIWTQRGWITSTPEWATSSPRLQSLFMWFHVTTWGWFFGWAVGAALFFGLLG